jgi:stage V sporulation protein AD
MILASCLINSNYVKNALCVVSSHNMSSEKQFRYPTEYGAPRKNSSTFTATGCACCFLSNLKSSVRVESATLGKMIDLGQNDPNDMGRVMAPSVIDTIQKHFRETGRSVTDYDLILTGDLGVYGQEIVRDYLRSYSDIYLDDSYKDCGVILYNLKKQKKIMAGGSGPVCSALVIYSYIYSLLKKKKVKRVLFLATGALFSPTMIHQGENIKSICHAISLEAVS